MAGKNSIFVNNSAPSVDDTWLNLQQNEGNNIILGSGQSLSDAISNQRVIGVSRFAANNFYIDSGVADAYVLTLAASMTNPVSEVVGQGYFIGMTIRFRAGNSNTGASTVNVNSAGIKNLKKEDGTTDLDADDISSTQDSVFRYNGTAFCSANGSASTTAKGTVELLTNAELAAGTDTTRAATAAAIASLFGTSILGDPGELKIPLIVGGVFVKAIIKYGVANDVTSSGTTVTFANAFPNAMLRCFLTPYQYSSSVVNPASAQIMAGANSFSTTGFFISNSSATENRSWQWMAIGY